MKRLQRALTTARAAALCCYGRGEVVLVDVGRALTAHVSNVHHCGSPWACPLCAPVVRQRRAMEIDAALRRHLGGGGGALFVTLTFRHHRGDSLASRLDPIAQSMRLALSGEPWHRRRSSLGYVGMIKAVEITHGDENGWHPHSHSLLLFEQPPTSIEVENFRAWLFGRWSSVAEARGLGSVTKANGVDVRPVTQVEGLSDYLTKLDGGWSPGLEIARSDLKHRTPFDLLRNVLVDGDARFAGLWCEYERATFGKRAVVWSRGLRELLCGIEAEASDEELASSEGLDLALVRALVPTAFWNSTLRDASTGRLLNDIERCAGALFFIADTLGHVLDPIGITEAVTHES